MLTLAAGLILILTAYAVAVALIPPWLRRRRAKRHVLDKTQRR